MPWKKSLATAGWQMATNWTATLKVSEKAMFNHCTVFMNMLNMNHPKVQEIITESNEPALAILKGTRMAFPADGDQIPECRWTCHMCNSCHRQLPCNLITHMRGAA